MKVFLSLIITTILALSLSACGCSNSTVGNTQTPGTTILPDILPTLDTNIPDPEINTQMPIYTEGTDSTENTNVTLPGIEQNDSNKQRNAAK